MRKALAWAGVLVFLLGPPAAAFKRTSPGDPAEDFALPTPDGQVFRLSEHLGPKATVLVFWAMWSPRSAEALSEFQELYREQAQAGLQVVGVNVEHQERAPGEAEEIAGWVARRGITFPVVIDEALEVFNAYGVIAVPSLALLDGGGTVRALLEGYSRMTRDAFKEEVKRALGLVAETGVRAEVEPSGPKPKGLAERYTRMGEVLLRRHMAARAERAFRKALEEDPEYGRAKEGLARAEALLNREQGREGSGPAAGAPAGAGEEPNPPPERASAGGGAAEPDPRAVRYVRMGRLLLKRGLYENARSVFQQAAELDPSYREAFEGWAEALEKLGRPDEARGVRGRAPNRPDGGGEGGGGDAHRKPGEHRGETRGDGGGGRGHDPDRDR